MKTIFLTLTIAFTNAIVYSQCKVIFSKISKVEQGFKKDAYGNLTDQRFVYCTLPNGQVKTVANTNLYLTKSWQAESGPATLLFAGTNTSKTVFLEVIKTGNRIKIFAANFYKAGSSFTEGRVQWDPSLTEQIGVSRLEYDGFDASEGWAFSKFAGDILIMTKNGVEFKFSIAKTQESYCNMYFKLI